MKSAPCKDCERRTVKPNCHATCKQYKEFVTERHEMYRKRAVESEIIGAYAEKSNRLNRKK